MCGIIGYTGYREAAPILLAGLERLEYRGYDSAGIAVLGDGGVVHLHKAIGKLRNLAQVLAGEPLAGNTGLGHTRWATHGPPTELNAHPHTDCTGDVTVIHNGIVENYLDLKAELIAQGHTFTSQTDTEVIPHLIEANLADGEGLDEAVRMAAKRLEGSQAILAICSREPGRIVALRLGFAGGVVVGHGDGEMFLASDLPAILPYTRRVSYLAHGEVATVTAEGARFYTLDGAPLNKAVQRVSYDPLAAAKGNYKHFMLKEIMEQPEAVTNTLRDCVDFSASSITMDAFPLSREEVRRLERVVLTGCGTSLHACLVGRYYMEALAGLPAEAEAASEMRYRNLHLDPRTLVVAVAQSGESADTLGAMERAKEQKARLLGVCNVEGSQATRLAEGTIFMRAGPEVAVCATKTFSTSSVALYLLACYLGMERGALTSSEVEGLLKDLVRLPALMGQVLSRERQLEALAGKYFRRGHFLYLGRGILYPIALEGALKLKEVSYIHAEGYPAGEMKHGPIALIDESMPVVALALRDKLYEKIMGNISEVKARGGTVIAVAEEGDREVAQRADAVIEVPKTPPLLSPLVAGLPLQLFAYYVAVRRGCDVDQPRNLAKTVTVE